MSLPMETLIAERDRTLLLLALICGTVLIAGMLIIHRVYRNIFSQKQKEAQLMNELRQSEQYFKALFNTSKNMTIINDKHVIKDANQAFFDFTGFKTIEDFQKQHDCICDMFLPKEGYLSKYMYAHYWADYIMNNPSLIHKAIIKKDDREYVFIVSMNAFTLNDKNIYFTIFNDITELVEKENMMLVQSRHAAMGEMIGIIARQWRQPLSVISLGASNILADVELDMIDPEHLKKIALDMMKQTGELSMTIEDFRNFFKPNKVKEFVNVDSVIDEALKILEKSLLNHHITIKKKMNSDTIIQIFSREFLQVLINIMSNAKDALIESGIDDPKISISTAEYRDFIEITICDNAKGINPDLIDKIFEPYFTTKSDKNGTGLGLYICKMILEKHLNGTIDVYNENGACFQIRLKKKR
ncbi:MAG: HAMP domain-containing histidine kinase [Campylobacterales bacterium]|nr:HAMP domain-containing histidine kinase [Campylobacterales bacterium]